jgi:hypothetical protein
MSKYLPKNIDDLKYQFSYRFMLSDTINHYFFHNKYLVVVGGFKNKIIRLDIGMFDTNNTFHVIEKYDNGFYTEEEYDDFLKKLDINTHHNYDFSREKLLKLFINNRRKYVIKEFLNI